MKIHLYMECCFLPMIKKAKGLSSRMKHEVLFKKPFSYHDHGTIQCTIVKSTLQVDN